jgi:hypothetical protein
VDNHAQPVGQGEFLKLDHGKGKPAGAGSAQPGSKLRWPPRTVANAGMDWLRK